MPSQMEPEISFQIYTSGLYGVLHEFRTSNDNDMKSQTGPIAEEI